MSLDPDVLVDRRRLRRKLGFWRVVAFFALAALIIGVIGWSTGLGDGIERRSAHIARITVSGFIGNDRRQIEMIEKVAKSDAVKGVIVTVNSTGGATTGGEALYLALRELSAKKPTVAAIGTVGASAAYMAALGTDHIVARGSAIVGSIGVLVQWPDVSDLMKTVGVKLEEVKSTPLKAEPQPFKPASPEAKAVLDRLVKDSYEWFVGIVQERRKFDRPSVLAVADGRVMTGRQALDARLVDAIGDEKTARTWLETARGVAKDLPVRDWKVSSQPLADLGVSGAFAAGLVRALGFEDLVPRPPRLDGLMSVWHLAPQKSDENQAGDVR